MIKDRTRINILFSCTGEAKRDFEPFVQDHAVVFVLNGRMTINDCSETLPQGQNIGKPNFLFPPDKFFEGFFKSIVPYFENPHALTENLSLIKTNELIELLLRKPQMQNILFNFEENFKIDIDAFMSKNFTHNIPLEQFATLTGRSLSTFKRDFQAIFNETPTKWLIKRRIELAYYLISKQNKKPVEVYYDVGFETFAHFSRTFKSVMGINPSEAQKNHS